MYPDVIRFGIEVRTREADRLPAVLAAAGLWHRMVPLATIPESVAPEPLEPAPEPKPALPLNPARVTVLSEPPGLAVISHADMITFAHQLGRGRGLGTRVYNTLARPMPGSDGRRYVYYDQDRPVGIKALAAARLLLHLESRPHDFLRPGSFKRPGPKTVDFFRLYVASLYAAPATSRLRGSSRVDVGETTHRYM
ncbi:MAG TPA: hypothetical protein VLE73_02635 [Candidatus Saccharimonadales bacterium]|nr:hypothetical protein [Candidatus Saccharimonadales bacterium]